MKFVVIIVIAVMIIGILGFVLLYDISPTQLSSDQESFIIQTDDSQNIPKNDL